MRARSMKAVFLWLSVLILLVMVASTAINAASMRSAFLENAERLLTAAHAQASSNIEKYVQDIENTALSMCYAPSMLQFLEEAEPVRRVALFPDVQAVYANIVSMNNAIIGFSIYDGDGNYITSGGASYQSITSRDSIEPSTQIRYDTAYPPNPYIGDSVSGYILTLPVLSKSASMRAPRVIGTVVFTVSLTFAKSQVHSGSLYPGSRMVLSAADDKALADSAQGTPATEPDVTAASTPIGKTGWTLTTSYEGELIADDMQAVWVSTLATSALVLVVILGFLFSIYRRIVTPIEGASRFMQGVSTHPEQPPVYRPKSRTYAELNAMTSSMNQMLASLNDKTDALVREEKRAHQAEVESGRLEILAYRSQINPHFLYNTLDCIGGMAYKHDAPEVAAISQSLSGMFRYAIKGGDFVTVEEELEHLREYALITRFRFMGRIDIDIQADESAAACTIPRLILQPVVENAVFHGLEKKLEPGAVTVRVFVRDQMLHLRVSDDGIGVPPERAALIARGIARTDEGDSQSGIGLQNIARRIELYYRGRGSLSFASREGEGSTVEIVLPVSKGGDTPCTAC